jgi:hypothetical protein
MNFSMDQELERRGEGSYGIIHKYSIPELLHKYIWRIQVIYFLDLSLKISKTINGSIFSKCTETIY